MEATRNILTEKIQFIRKFRIVLLFREFKLESKNRRGRKNKEKIMKKEDKITKVILIAIK